MPIKGISDVRRLPRIGKVRLGVKAISKKTQREYPKAVDYFVVTPDDNITFKSAAKSFHRVYGDKPRMLEIMFPLNDTERFFQQWYRRYGSGTGLICKGDGEIAWEVNRDTGEMIERECNPAECEWVEKKHCRPIGTLMFLLPQVEGLGCWQLDTSSWNSIVNLNSVIEFIKSVTGGNIAMIPLTLALRPKDVQPEGKKKTVWVLDVALEGMTMGQLLQPPDLKTYYLPPDTTKEMPDDLYPASMQVKTDAKKVVEAEVVDEPEPEAEIKTIADAFPQAEVKGVEVALPQAKVGGPSLTLEERWAAGIKELAKETGFSDEAIEELLKRWADKPRNEKRYQDALEYIEAHADPPEEE